MGASLLFLELDLSPRIKAGGRRPGMEAVVLPLNTKTGCGQLPRTELSKVLESIDGARIRCP